MASFSDDFERPNGPVGNGWQVLGGNPQIIGGAVINTGDLNAFCVHEVSGLAADQVVDGFFSGGLSVPITGICARSDASGQNMWYAQVQGPTIVGQLYKVVNNVYTKVSGDVPTTYATQYFHLILECRGNTITFKYNDHVVYSVTDDAVPSGTYAGFSVWNSGNPITDFSAADALPDATLTVTPDPLWVGGGQTLMTATGTDTSWTPGEPGSTTITADHGTVDFQRVVSATEVEFYYTPEEYIGPIVFSESEYSLSDTVNAVAVMPEGYPTLDCRLTPEGAALINDTADEDVFAKRLFARNSYIGTAPIDVTYGEVVKWLGDFLINNGWNTLPAPAATFQVLHELLNGGYDPTPGVNVLGQLNTLISDLADHAQQLADVQGPGGVTMATLAAALSDLRGLGSPSIADVLTAVQNADSTEVLNYLSAMRGNEVVTLLQVVTALTNIQTLNGYDLGTIVQRLDDRPTTLYMDAAFALTNGALGGLALEIAGLYKALGVVEATNIFDVISGIVGDLFSGLGSTLVDNFLDSIFGPESPLPQVVLVPPIWPGVNRANVGNAVALANGQTIAGPLHGLLFTIDGYPAEKYGYHFGSVTSWGRVGSVIFATDRGDYERSQTFAIDTQVLCPQQMAIADHAIIKVNTGWSGTVRPWTITQPSGGG